MSSGSARGSLGISIPSSRATTCSSVESRHSRGPTALPPEQLASPPPASAIPSSAPAGDAAPSAPAAIRQLWSDHTPKFKFISGVHQMLEMRQKK